MAKAVTRKRVVRKPAKRATPKKTLVEEIIEDLSGEPKKVWGEGTPWRTKSEFYVWLRGLLRRGWSKHPLRVSKITSNRFKADKHFKNGKVMQVWHCKCEICGITGPQKDFEVDHIDPAGSLRCYDDIPGFITRLLFIGDDDLRICCKQCNSTLSYLQMNSHKMPIEECLAQKFFLSMKEPELLTYMEKNGLESKTKAGRRKVVVDYYMTTKESKERLNQFKDLK